ncbi:universal stress protein [Halostella litorea]|uniref:universal stress protein n=1 Tax=Halostella litorea TaxID=2528831 RepID=UPI0010920E98|nr:universal stress protein [Halostella litorea]
MDRPEVLVAVSNPEHVEQLVRSASDLARTMDGGVRIVSVVVKSHDSPFGVFSDETIIEEYSGDRRALLDRASRVAPEDVPVDAEVLVARSVEDGLLRAVAEMGPAALLVGWHGGGRRRSDVVLGTSVDALLRRAPCDVYVERIGRIADGVDDVLLPVAGGPHVRPAAAMAKAVAAANDASVTALAVAAPEDDRDRAAEWAANGRAAVEAAPGPAVEVTATVGEADDAIDALVAAADDSDLVVFGATRAGTLQARLVGSVPRAVADRTDRTVLIARASEAARTGLRGLIAGFRRR